MNRDTHVRRELKTSLFRKRFTAVLLTSLCALATPSYSQNIGYMEETPYGCSGFGLDSELNLQLYGTNYSAPSLWFQRLNRDGTETIVTVPVTYSQALGSGSHVVANSQGEIFIGGPGYIAKVSTSGTYNHLWVGGGRSPSPYPGPGLSETGDGQGNEAFIGSIWGMAISKTGNIYFIDGSQNFGNCIRMASQSGDVTTLAGSYIYGGQSHEDGTGASVRFNRPTGLAVDSLGNVYIADNGNHVIRRMSPTGSTITWAGLPGVSGFQDGFTAARFKNPESVAIDPQDNVYVSDYGNRSIRKISPSGEVTTIWDGRDRLFSVRNGQIRFFNGNLYSIESVAIESGAVLGGSVYKSVWAKPKLSVSANNYLVRNGSTTPKPTNFTEFGSTNVSSGSITRTFYTQNSLGSDSLHFTNNPVIVISGANAADFRVTTSPLNPVPAYSSSEFSINFAPRDSGLRTATVVIHSNDENSPYTFAISGTGVGSSVNDELRNALIKEISKLKKTLRETRQSGKKRALKRKIKVLESKLKAL